MIYYASINYSFVQSILTIKLLYLKFLVKNVNEIDIWEWETNILEI